ncbi:hypothetical protein [Psychroserpens damuponensis]|uniref:hypothetical protein n=1 Tax=Psychroserpens damuponensis TaxID=943936 RepID=UPI000ABF8D18|nr:hypothetical protein [Psychroserpens damuponensis]
MKTNKYCKHCHQMFESRRSNHVYCTTSCKTKASYKRNDYKYVSGHYKKDETIALNQENSLVNSNEIMASIKAIDERLSNLKPSTEINTVAISNSAIGSMTSDAVVFSAKKIFAPNTLPATKGDIESLKEELKQLKTAIIFNKTKKFPSNF